MKARLLSAGLFLLAIPLFVSAAEFRTGDQPSLESGQTVQDDLYMAGGSVVSAGTVRGDLVSGGGSILVSGPVSGDLMLGGGNITVTSEISDDVRIGGGQVTIQGNVRGDVLIGGGQVILAGERITGDIAVAGGTVRIESAIGGDARIAGGDIYLNGPVAGNVEIEAEKLTLGPRAIIAGDLSYRAADAATMQDGAVVRGETQFDERVGREEAEAGLAAFFTFWLVAKFFMLLVGSLLIGMAFQRYSRELVATAAMQPLLEFGRGLVTVIVLPILSFILIATIIGIPLGVIGLLMLAVMLIFASLIAPIILGSVVHKLIWKPARYEVNWQTILLGVVLYSVLGLIPVIGFFAISLLKMAALGAALKLKWSLAKDWR